MVLRTGRIASLLLAMMVAACGEPVRPSAPRAPERTNEDASAAAASEAVPHVAPAFTVAATSDKEIRLFSIPGRTFATSGLSFGYVDKDEIKLDPAMGSGLSGGGFSVTAMGGRWPKGLILQASRREKRTIQHDVYDWAGPAGGWRERRTRAMRVVGFEALPDGRTLALDKTGVFTVPLGPSADVPVANENGRTLRAEAVAASPLGHVFATGFDCPDTEAAPDALDVVPKIDPASSAGSRCGVPVALRFGLKQIHAKKDFLPDVTREGQFEMVGLVAPGGNDAYVAGNEYIGRSTHEYIAHYDGYGWRRVPGPNDNDVILELRADPAGSLWVTTLHGDLWTQARHQPWTRIDLPAAPVGSRFCALDVWVRAPEDLWVAVVELDVEGRPHGAAILHNRPAGHVADFAK